MKLHYLLSWLISRLISRLIACTFFALLPFYSLLATEGAVETSSNGFGLGMKLSDYAGNLGLGLTSASPRFFHQRLHFDFSADYVWLPGVPVAGTSSTSWQSYGYFRVGICSDYGRSASFRISGCGGAILLLTGEQISNQGTAWGGYGIFDFELFLEEMRHRAFYIELGAQGTCAQANKQPGSPAFASGFISSVGWRYFFE